MIGTYNRTMIGEDQFDIRKGKRTGNAIKNAKNNFKEKFCISKEESLVTSVSTSFTR